MVNFKIPKGIKTRTNDIYCDLDKFQLIISTRNIKSENILGFRVSLYEKNKEQETLIYVDFPDKIVKVMPNLEEFLTRIVNNN